MWRAGFQAERLFCPYSPSTWKGILGGERGHLMRYLSHIGLALLIVAGSFASLQALPSHGIMETFYTDNTFTDEVGYWYASCSGAPYLSGSRSPYVYYEDWSCETGDYFDCYY